MYFIVNTSNSELVIGDLKRSLGPRKSIDLDLFHNRDDIEKSKDLKECVRKGIVEIRHISNKVPDQSNIVQNNNDSNQDIAALTKAITDEVKKQFSDITEKISNQKDNQEDVVNAINKLTEIVSQNGMAKNTIVERESEGQKTSIPIIEDEDIDEDKLAEIHAKSMKKMGNKSTSTVNYESKKERSTISDNISDLENLLG